MDLPDDPKAGRLEGTHTPWSLTMTGYCFYLTLVPSLESALGAPADGSNLDAHHDPNGS